MILVCSIIGSLKFVISQNLQYPYIQNYVNICDLKRDGLCQTFFSTWVMEFSAGTPQTLASQKNAPVLTQKNDPFKSSNCRSFRQSESCSNLEKIASNQKNTYRTKNMPCKLALTSPGKTNMEPEHCNITPLRKNPRHPVIPPEV